MKLNDLKNLDREDLLNTVGLQTLNSPVASVASGVALFGVGVLVGAGIGLLFAPKAGDEIRSDLKNRVNDFTNKMRNRDTEVRGTQYTAENPSPQETAV